MNKPYWPRTMQLRPAHMHARDAYVEALLEGRVSRSVPHAYGITEIEIDHQAAASGDLALRRLTAFFPSGAVVRVDATRPLRRSLVGRADGGADVFVAVPLAIVRGPNVSFEGEAARSTRFIARPRKDSGDLTPMRLNPEILVEGEDGDGFEVLRLGRVTSIGKALRFERSVFATALRVGASDGLSAALRELVATCEQRCGELLRFRDEHPLKLGAVVASEVPQLQLSVILRRFLPLLRDAAARRSTHPYELYGLLGRLYGALTVFRGAEVVPPYDHDEQGSPFSWLVERIERLVREAARETTTVLPFRRKEDGTFRLSFKSGDLAGKRPMLVLRGADEEFLRDRVPSLLKMASPQAIKPLLHSALRGAAVAVEFDPPDVVPRQQGVVSYRIDMRDKHWLDIEDRQEVQLHLAGAPADLEAFLYGIDRAGL